MKTASEVADEVAVEVVAFAHSDAGSILVDAALKQTIVAIVQRALEDSFRLGFEHAVAGGEEAGRFVQKGTLPLVCYFADEAGRKEFIDVIQGIHPRWASVKIPERKR